MHSAHTHTARPLQQADQEEEKGHVKGRAVAPPREGGQRLPAPGSPPIKIELTGAAAEDRTFAIRGMRIN